MEEFLKKLYLPPLNSHKGQNGKLLLIGGSKLFHAASLWALTAASRIVDLVHYSSIPQNNQIVLRIKTAFKDGIVIPREEIENYIKEDDCILIGPGMIRKDNLTTKDKKQLLKVKNLKDLKKIHDEGLETYLLTGYLLTKYPSKKWVIDAGSLQMLELSWIPPNAILTPHHKEFEQLKAKIPNQTLKSELQKVNLEKQVQLFAKSYHCTILLKGKVDLIASPSQFIKIKGGNSGMTKGGTGDVLAGLVAAFYCKNNPFISAAAASYINKKTGEALFKKMGYYFNASDLVNEIPLVMKKLLLAPR